MHKNTALINKDWTGAYPINGRYGHDSRPASLNSTFSRPQAANETTDSAEPLPFQLGTDPSPLAQDNILIKIKNWESSLIFSPLGLSSSRDEIFKIGMRARYHVTLSADRRVVLHLNDAHGDEWIVGI